MYMYTYLASSQGLAINNAEYQGRDIFMIILDQSKEEEEIE